MRRTFSRRAAVLAALLALAAALWLAWQLRPKGYSGFIAMGVEATGYTAQDGTLTLRLPAAEGTREARLPVRDPALRDALAAGTLDPASVIGVSMTLKIPAGALRERNVDPGRFQVFYELMTDRWDAYLTIETIDTLNPAPN